ncbi:MAG: hypothetical protein R3C29_03635 [Dehalococcoidia bacterium]|nr:hypothetical protein [Dehalococcoidia bacterium]
MRELIYALLLLVLASAQTTVAPIFRVGGAELQFVLLFVLLVLLLEGPRPAMIATPIAAVSLAFVMGRSPALMLISFLPLVVAAAWLDELRLPVTRFAVVAGAFAGAGIWARFVLALSAMVQGADIALGTLVIDVLLAGILLDLALLAVASLVVRLVGFEQRPLSLGAARY